ncbi:MAG: AAA family ATPase [Anaerolineae bacterium]|nr:AAA family ATPase [Anaerolineae bacterium]
MNRDDELRTVFNRIRNGESSAIVGEPHIGKTSFLKKLADEQTQKDYLGKAQQELVTSMMDLLDVGKEYTPANFWEEALEPLRLHPGHKTTSECLAAAAEADYARSALESLFEHLARQERVLLLLLDEFERLLIHPKFQDPSFFAGLRKFAGSTGGLILIVSSRLSLGKMNTLGRELLNVGSPFFNTCIELRLDPFEERTVGTLLDQGGDVFSIQDRRFIRRVAGRHPYLLQAMAAALFETQRQQRQIRAAESFYERISFHFDDLWEGLDDNTRTIAVVLSLLELGGWALGQKFACGEIEQVKKFGPELRRLAVLGLAEQVGEEWQFDRQHLLLWQGERWTMSSQAFVWWVRDVVIAPVRPIPAYDEWLRLKRYELLLTQQQWDELKKAVSSIPESMTHGVAKLARILFEASVKSAS